MENTISEIVNAIPPPDGQPLRHQFAINEITDMYDEIQSEEHYDSDDISTIICERLVNKADMSGNEEYFRFIYDIFDTCKKHVRKLNDEYDRKVIERGILKICEAEAQRSKDYLTGLIAPR